MHATVPEAATKPVPVPPASPRLVSLDAFRGATIVAMILVNNPGSWAPGMRYAPLDHAAWHGCTPTDLIFPFFLFIVGVAIPFSQSKRAVAASKARLVLNIFRRAAILFGLGILLGLIPFSSTTGFFNLGSLRIPGVLQRIAVCYAVVALLALHFSWRGMIVSALVACAVYCAIMFGTNVPGYGRGVLDREGNAAGYIDGLIMANHLYSKRSPPSAFEQVAALELQRGLTDPATVAAREKLVHTWFDPEGLVSTLPAIATTVCGVLVGLWLRTERTREAKIAAVFSFGVLGVITGLILNAALMPINKALWTPSYVVYTAGLACLGLGLCYWIIDILGYRRWATPLVACGMNAITIFFLAGAVGRLMNAKVISSVDANGNAVKLAIKPWLYEGLFVPAFQSKLNASLAWALVFVGLFVALAMLMHWRRIYIKV